MSRPYITRYARRYSDVTRDLVETEIRSAVDRAVTELDVDPAVVLEILKQVTADEEEFQGDGGGWVSLSET